MEALTLRLDSTKEAKVEEEPFGRKTGNFGRLVEIELVICVLLAWRPAKAGVELSVLLDEDPDALGSVRWDVARTAILRRGHVNKKRVE